MSLDILDLSDKKNWTPEQWEQYLEDEWLGNLDKEIWIQTHNTKKEIDSVLNLNSLFEYINKVENEKNVRVNVDEDEKSISIFDNDNWNIIWEIKPWNYTYNWLSQSEHMFHVVNDWYKWRWFWKLLIELYIKFEKFWYYNFKLPRNEFTHTPSMLNLLTSYWYEIVWKYDLWEFIEMDEIEISQIYDDISNWVYSLDDKFNETYKLTLKK